MSKEFPHPFKEMHAQQVRMFKRLPLRMSQWGLLEIKENFAREGYYDASGRFIRWKKRRGERSLVHWKKSSSDNGRALLMLKGRLKRSLRPAPLYNEARVATDVPYAEVHQKGFKGTVTQKVKSHNRKAGKKGGNKNSRRNLDKVSKVKAHTRKIKQNIPARPYMEVGPQAIGKWGDKILTEIDQIFVKI